MTTPSGNGLPAPAGLRCTRQPRRMCEKPGLDFFAEAVVVAAIQAVETSRKRNRLFRYAGVFDIMSHGTELPGR